jgi:hypothetical protein
VLNDLDNGRGVEPLQSPVSVSHRAVERCDAGGLPLGQAVELERFTAGPL